MSTSDGAVQLDLRANTKQFEADADAAAGRVKSRFAGVGAAIGKLFAVKALVDFGNGCTQVASRLTEVQNVVDVVFPEMSDQVNAWSRNLVEQFGLSETKAKEYVGTLGSMARSMGFTEGQAYGMATGIAELAGDVASFYDISSDEAYDKLTAIFTGMVQPLRQLGINMTQASLDAYAMANGFGKVVSEMNEAEQAMLRYQFVSDRLRFAQGDFERTSSSWANQLRILSMRFEELRVAIGNSLILMLAPVIQTVNTIIAALTTAANAVYRFVAALASTGLGRFAKRAASMVGALAGNTSEAADSTGELSAAQDGAAGSAGRQAAAQAKLNRTLASFDRINKLASDSASGGGGGGVGGGGGIGGISDAIASLGDAADATFNFQEALDSIVLPRELELAFGRLHDSVARLAGILSGAMMWAWENVLKPLGEWAISEVAPEVVEILAGALDTLSGVLEVLAPVWQVLWEHVVKPFCKALGDAFVKNLEFMSDTLDFVAATIEEMVPWAEQFATYLEAGLEALEKMLGLDSKLNRFRKGYNITTGPVGVNARGGNVSRKGVADLLTPGGGWDGSIKTLGGLLRKQSGMGSQLGTMRSQLSTTIDMTRTLSALWGAIGSKRISLKAEDLTKDAVAGAISQLAKVTDKSVTLTAKDSVADGVNAANAKLATVTSKTVTLSSKDSVKAGVDSATTKLANFKDKTNTLRTNAKPAVESLDLANGKLDKFKDKSITLKVTPKLTKEHLKATGILNGTADLSFFAQGGYVERNTPRLAVIGDNTREGEIVSPESKFQSMLDKAAGSSDMTEVVQLLERIASIVDGMDTAVYLDGRAITRAVVGNVNRQAQATGRSPIIV